MEKPKFPIPMGTDEFKTLLHGIIVTGSDATYVDHIKNGLSVGHPASELLVHLKELLTSLQINLLECQGSLVTGLQHGEAVPLVGNERFIKDLFDSSYFNWLRNLPDSANVGDTIVPMLVRLYQIRIFALWYDQTEKLKAQNIIEVAVAAIVHACRETPQFPSMALTGYANFLTTVWAHTSFEDADKWAVPTANVNSTQYEEWLDVLGGQDVIWMKLQELVNADDATLEKILQPLWDKRPHVIDVRLAKAEVSGLLNKLFSTCVVSQYSKYISSVAPLINGFIVLPDITMRDNVFSVNNENRFELLGFSTKTIVDNYDLADLARSELAFTSQTDLKVFHKHTLSQNSAILIMPVVGTYDNFNPISDTVDDSPRRFYAYFKRL